MVRHVPDPPLFAHVRAYSTLQRVLGTCKLAIKHKRATAAILHMYLNKIYVQKRGENHVHTVITAIVYAKDRREALLRARGIFDRLVEDNVFDYYALFDENRPASGTSRWGRLPVVAKAASRVGKQLLEDKWHATRRAFDKAITKIREGINNSTDDELFTDLVAVGGMPGMFRYWGLRIGRTEGLSVFLYDDDATGIQTEDHFTNALNKWRRLYEEKDEVNPNRNKEVWIVPADVHF